MDHALAAEANESEFPKIEVSDKAAELLVTWREREMLDSKISSAFNTYLGEQSAAGNEILLKPAEEKILPLFAAKDVFICSNRSLLKAETETENFFTAALANCGLMLCNRVKVAEEFLDSRMADDFSPYEYTPDGVNYYSSFLEAMEAAVAMGGGHAIEMRSKEVIPIFEP